jgi:hypothetical protein
MSVGISIYRIILKNGKEEIDVQRKFRNIINEEKSLYDIVASVFEKDGKKNNVFKHVFFKKRKEENAYFGKFFYGKILETNKSVIIGNEEKEMKAWQDTSRDEFYFSLFQYQNKLKNKGQNTIFLFLQTNGNVGIKTGVIDNVYLKKIEGRLKDLNEANATNIEVEIASYNITEERIIEIFDEAVIKKVEFYTEKETEEIKKRLEGSTVLKSKEFKVCHKTIIDGIMEPITNFFRKEKGKKNIYEIIVEGVETDEVEIGMTFKNKKRKLIKKTNAEKIDSIQAKFDVTDEYRNASGDDEKIFSIFLSLFCDIIKEK